MKNILLFVLVFSYQYIIIAQTPLTKETLQSSITKLPDDSVTNTIKEMTEKETVSINRDNHKITTAAYYFLLACGDYSASAVIKNDSIIITINNSNICNGDHSYFKLETIIDNPNNIHYKVKVDERFTFLKKGERIQQFRDDYLIGDIDGDKTANNVITEYEKVIEANDSISNDCGRGTCDMTAKFGKDIPDITQSSCNWMSVEALPDLNRDGRDEIIMATHYSHGCCHNVLVWSYDGKKWNLLAEANTFDDDEPDALRVKKKNNRYYLHYRNWDDKGEDIVSKKKIIRIK